MAITHARIAPAIQVERRFWFGMAIALAIGTFVGFAPTYYLGDFLNGVTPRGVSADMALSPAVHLHGLTATAWMLLLVAQTGLVSIDRRDLHRAMGLAALPIGLGIAVTAIWVSLASARAGQVPPNWTPPQFLLIQFGTLSGFLVLGAIGLIMRRRADFHKRLMILATISMMLPAMGRITRIFDIPYLPKGTIGGMVLVDLFLIPLIVHDLRSRGGRLHPATLWGGGAIVLAQPLRFFLAKTEGWEQIAQTLIR